MSAVASLSSTEEVITSRRTESLDAHEISKLITPSTTGMFGRINVLYLLEKSNLAVTLENDNKEIVAHAAFLDYPNHSLADPAEWVPWIQSNYKSNEYTDLQIFYSNIHKEILSSMYSISNFFLLTKVEDHDDLIPLFTQYNSDLTAMYGDYFLAELIEAQNEQNHAVVCEKEAIITPDADIPAKGDTTYNLKYSSGICMEEADKKIFHPVYKGSSNAFCIQLFVIDEKYEMRYSYQIFMTIS